MEKLKLWDFTKSLQNKKNYLGNHDSFNSTFSAFMTNRMFSGHKNIVTLANVMNLNGPHSGSAYTPKMIYDFYFHGMPKVNEYIGFPKKEKTTKDIEQIMNWFQVNKLRAISYSKIIKKDEMEYIRSFYKEQDKNKKPVRR